MVALNNPSNGGTHLPDITVITPVFDAAGTEVLFFVGSRGHHADIGGLTPGSTPPGSKTLEEEGVVIDDFLLVDGGRIREAEFRAVLAGATYPARSPDVNVADIKAQVASNEKAVQELQRAVAEFGLATVRAYMKHVMDNAEESVRRVLERLPDGTFETTIDDGAPLKVSIRVDHEKRRAVIDFTGTGPQRPDNFNAPSAVCRAVVLYCFRCLVGEDIPLNDGCLKPLEIIIPEGTFLSPRPGAAVVAGNTEVSQMTCNAVLARPERLRLRAGDDEQRAVRRRHLPVLRDGVRRRRCRPRLQRRRPDPDPHDQHPHDRPRDPRTALPGAA